MTMKKILMAAVAISALSAGVATAATISTLSVIGTNASYAVTGATLLSDTTPAGYEPYTIANERNIDLANQTIYTKLQINPSSGTAIGAGQYVVTYTISGGTFDFSGIGISSLVTDFATAADGTAASTSGTPSSTTLSFNITVPASDSLTSVLLKVPVKLGAGRTNVTVGGSIATAAGANVDGGTVPAVTIVDYRDGLNFAVTKRAATLTVASLFKDFTAGTYATASTADIGTAVGFNNSSAGTLAGTSTTDLVYKDLIATTLTTADIASTILSVTGDLTAVNLAVNTTGTTYQTADVVASAPGVVTLSDLTKIKAGTSVVQLRQKSTIVTGVPSSYTVTPTITLPAGLTPLTYAAKTLGAVSYAGTTIYAPWVSDGVNGITYSIRIGNLTATQIAAATISLANPTGTPTATTCNTAVLPGSGDLIITSASLKTCFGSFGRSDVLITLQADPASFTAKMRSVSANAQAEVTLGKGSGNALAN